MPAYGMEQKTIQKGICYVTWDKDRFASLYSDKSLEKLAGLGVEYIAIIATHYQDNTHSTEIMPTDNSPSDRSVIHAIQKAHRLGMKVLLKPHIDLINKADDEHWRADIGFAYDEDWQKWFMEYQDFILHYARMAEKLNVELFCVGTELSFTTQKNDLWRNMVISPVKNIYSGKLIYAANWDNYKNVKFWQDLDYVGIDAYFPLSYRNNPSLSELRRGWEKWKMELGNFYSSVKKPIIFTEIGYASSPHAPAEPWKGGNGGNADLEVQAKCYKSFFDSLWGCSWLAGVYWWKWDTNTRAGGQYNRHFTPQNKPAQDILKIYYKPQNNTGGDLPLVN